MIIPMFTTMIVPHYLHLPIQSSVPMNYSFLNRNSIMVKLLHEHVMASPVHVFLCVLEGGFDLTQFYDLHALKS